MRRATSGGKDSAIGSQDRPGDVALSPGMVPDRRSGSPITAPSLSARMDVDKAQADWFRVINHLAASAVLKAGDKVKLVTEDNAQASALPSDPSQQTADTAALQP